MNCLIRDLIYASEISPICGEPGFETFGVECCQAFFVALSLALICASLKGQVAEMRLNSVGPEYSTSSKEKQSLLFKPSRPVRVQ